LLAAAERHEQRREVLDGWVRVGHSRRFVSERKERVDVCSRHRLGDPVVEVDRPRGCAFFAHEVLADEGQAVGHEATADDQGAFVTQWGQPATDLEQVLGVQIGHRDLQHWDVGVGIHAHQRHPGAVVEAAVGSVDDRLGVGHEGLDLCGELGRAG